MSGALLGTSAARTEVGAEQRARRAGAGADVRTGSRVPAASVDPAVSPAPLPSSGSMNFWGGGQRVPSRGARP